MTQGPGGSLNIKMPSYSIGIPMLKIRRSLNRVIFNMEIPIPGKTVFVLKQVPDVFIKSHEAFARYCGNI